MSETRRGRPQVKVDLEELRRLRRQELSWREIGRLLGIGASTALNLWRKAG